MRISLTFGKSGYRLGNREIPQNSQKVLFGYFGGLPGKILKKYSPGRSLLSKSIPKVLQEYFWSIFDGNGHLKGAAAFGRRPLGVNIWFKISKSSPKVLPEYFWNTF